MKVAKARTEVDGYRRLSVLVAILGAGFALWLYATPHETTPISVREQGEAVHPPERGGSVLPVPGGARVPLPTPRVTGQVRDGMGEAIAGANVCATCADARCGEPGSPPLRCATTAADGGYVLGPLAVGLRQRLLASAPGYSPALGREQKTPWLSLGEGAQEQVDFVLERGGARIAGVISDAYGGPIAGALVTATDVQGGLGSQTVSDDDGHFALPLAEGGWHVRASAAGYHATSALLYAPSEHAELVLAVAGSIQGRVLSAVDGRAVAEIEVRATKHARLLLAAGDGSATSDAAGAFLIEPLAAGSYELIARAPRWYGSAPSRTALAIGERASGVEIRVRPAVTVQGKVLSEPDQAPCARGNVYFASVSEGGPSEDGVALLAPIVDGEVAIDGVPAGEYSVQVTCEGYLARAAYDRVRVDAVDVVGLRWPVTRGLRVTGQLIDAAGRGVPARVVRASPEGAPEGHARAVTDANGGFELTALMAARYQIAAEDAPESSQTIDLSAPAAPPRLQLKLRATGTIEVRLTPARQAESAWVQAIGTSAQRTALRLGADRLELRDLPPGEYRVYASDGRNRPVEQSATVTLSAPVQLNLTLPSATVSLQGQVVDARGAPVADATVTVVPSRSPALPGAEPSGATMTHVDGTFVIPQLIAGDRYNVQVEHPAEGRATLLDAAPGGTVVLRLGGRS